MTETVFGFRRFRTHEEDLSQKEVLARPKTLLNLSRACDEVAEVHCY